VEDCIQLEVVHRLEEVVHMLVEVVCILVEVVRMLEEVVHMPVEVVRIPVVCNLQSLKKCFLLVLWFNQILISISTNIPFVIT